jgi:hypothetical protein
MNMLLSFNTINIIRQVAKRAAIQTQRRENLTRTGSAGMLNSKTATFRAAISINNDQ